MLIIGDASRATHQSQAVLLHHFARAIKSALPNELRDASQQLPQVQIIQDQTWGSKTLKPSHSICSVMNSYSGGA